MADISVWSLAGSSPGTLVSSNSPNTRLLGSLVILIGCRCCRCKCEWLVCVPLLQTDDLCRVYPASCPMAVSPQP